MKKLMMAAGAALIATTAMAAPASAAMLVQFYTVPQDNKDFGNQNVTGVINPAVATAIGAMDRPVALPALGAKDVAADNELLWWQAANLTSTQVLSNNSYSNSNFYPGNGTGTTDQNGLFQAAIFSGSFTLGANQAGSYTFSLGADDDAYLYVDGNTIAQLGGVHSAATQNFSTNLSAGAHTFQLFYADRQPTGAVLNFSLPNGITGVAGAVPEPASWAMMILGVGAIGFTMRSAKRRSDEKFDAKIKRISYGAAS